MGERLAGVDRRLSMNSSATGMMPLPMMASTAWPATSFRPSNGQHGAAPPRGQRRMRTVTSVMTASCPSLPVSSHQS